MSRSPYERVEITVVNTMPLLVGWYEPGLVDYRVGIRPTEIKGIWRWWARAFIAGVLYDEGYRIGTYTRREKASGKGILCRPRDEAIKVVSKIVGEDLGLGTTSQVSRLRIYVNPLERLAPTGSGMWEGKLQRVKLLSLGREKIEVLEPNQRFKIVVEYPSSQESEKIKNTQTAIKILIAALQLTGVGKGSRRGLGSLDIIPGESKGIESIVSKGDLKRLLEEIREGCEAIVNRKKAKLDETLSKGQEECPLPPMPVVSETVISKELQDCPVSRDKDAESEEGPQDYPISEISTHRVPPDKFPDIHNFFVRTYRCKKLKGTHVCSDDIRNSLSAWFLGLPRSQRSTGYIVEAVSRRASPVIVAFHRDGHNIFPGGVYLTTMLSCDWPTYIEWREGAKPVGIYVDAEKILCAYKAFKHVFNKQYIKQYIPEHEVGGEENVVWPQKTRTRAC